MRLPFACASLLLALAAVDAPAQKQKDLTEISLEELMSVEVENVWGASKHIQKVTEAPSSITIITAEEIARFGYRTLAEVLRGVRGFYVTYDRNYTYFGLRGFTRPGDYNTRILILVDGHRINDAVYDGTYIGTEFPVDVDLIERVEVIRGPSSSLYGTSAFFGVVNVVTKRGPAVEGAQIAAEAGSHGTGKGRVTWGGFLPHGVEMLLSASFFGSRGPRKLFFPEFQDEPSGGIARDVDDDSYRSFFSNVSYRGLALQAAYVSREKGVPTASFGTVFNDPRNRTLDERAYADLRYQRALRNGWELTAGIAYDHTTYDGSYVYAAEEDGGELIINRDLSDGDTWTAEAKLSRTVLRRHHLILGAEYRHHFRQQQQNFDAGFDYLDDRRSSRTGGIYLQDEWQIARRVLLSAGLRSDYYSRFGNQVNPRVGLIIEPARHTTLKFLYGQAFRSPSAFEMYYRDGFSSKANTSQQPENIRTFEIAVDHYVRKRLRIAASVYRYALRNLISQRSDPEDGLLYYTNAERITANGVEVKLEAMLNKSIQLRTSWAVQDARDVTGGVDLSNSPHQIGSAQISVPLVAKKVFAGIEVLHAGDTWSTRRNPIDGHTICNVTLLGRHLARGVEASAGVYNVFSQHYGLPGGAEHRQDVIPQDGRTFRLRIAYTFGGPK